MKRRFFRCLALASATAAVAVPAAHAKVEIFLIRYDPPGRDKPNAEYVILKNNTSRAFSLRGWTLRNARGVTYRFRARKIGAWATLIVYSGKGRNTAERVYWGRSSPVWNNRRDVATLRNRGGRVVDRCAYRRTSFGSKHC